MMSINLPYFCCVWGRAVSKAVLPRMCVEVTAVESTVKQRDEKADDQTIASEEELGIVSICIKAVSRDNMENSQ